MIVVSVRGGPAAATHLHTEVGTKKDTFDAWKLEVVDEYKNLSTPLRWVRVCISMCMCVCVRAYVCACARVSVCVCARVPVCVCVRVYFSQ